MIDPFNPTDEEILKWGYDPQEIPQDWGLFITSPERTDLLVRLASDLKYPARQFFLSGLSLLVGDAVRTGGIVHALAQIEEALRRAEGANDSGIRQWIERPRALIRHPETFEYDKWCGGRLAYESE